jgi:cytochrome c biogenesis protein CcmG/thiol:disulfide interchange protein DsbE
MAVRSGDPSPVPASTDRSRRHPWRRRVWLLAGLASVAVVAAVVVAVRSDPPEPPERGTPVSGQAPHFELEGLRNPDRTVSLADFRGRPVVVNFFAAWCAPCRREMPALESAHQKVKDDIAFVGIDNQDIRSDALALLEETGVTYPAGFDPRGDVARAFGILGMPTTVFVSADGEMVERVTGEMTEERLLATIDRLFGNTQAG